MKKTLLSLLAVACIAVASQLISCFLINLLEQMNQAHESTITNRYRPHEMIVMFKERTNTQRMSMR